MADNDAKTDVFNLTLAKTKSGMQDTGVNYSTGIDDTVFADFTTADNETIKRFCLYYESCLKRCLKDIRPNFAKRFADLGNEITINKEYADYDYLFELPSDFLAFVRQTYETDRKTNIVNCEVRNFTSYAHTVTGDDDEVYICTTAHTSADDTDDGQPLDDDGDGNWTEDEDDEYEGAEWEAGKAYKASQTGKLFLTEVLSNEDADSAYIEYIPYEQAGINDDPTYYTEEFKNALATLIASEMELDYERRKELLNEYRTYARPEAQEEEGKSMPEEKTQRITTSRSNLTVGQ